MGCNSQKQTWNILWEIPFYKVASIQLSNPRFPRNNTKMIVISNNIDPHTNSKINHFYISLHQRNMFAKNGKWKCV